MVSFRQVLCCLDTHIACVLIGRTEKAALYSRSFANPLVRSLQPLFKKIIIHFLYRVINPYRFNYGIHIYTY